MSKGAGHRIGKLFTSCTSNRKCLELFRIYKELKNLNIKKTTQFLKMEHRAKYKVIKRNVVAEKNFKFRIPSYEGNTN